MADKPTQDQETQVQETREVRGGQAAPARKGKAQVEAEVGRENTVALVYVGPNLGRPLYIKQFQTWRGGLPGHVAEACAAQPELKRLFVPVAELAAARNELGRPTSALAKASAAVLRARAAEQGKE